MNRAPLTWPWFLGITGTATALAVALVPPPISSDEKRAVDDRVTAIWADAARHLDLHGMRPAIVWDEPEFYGAPRHALAATVCGNPRSLVVFDPADAVRDPVFFGRVTVPHELAHAVMCELKPNAPASEDHNAEWQLIARQLGMQEDL